MKAAIYARVSTDRQGTENQLRELRAYCGRQGWEIAGEYVDEDVEGKVERKPRLEALLLDAHQRKFDVVAFWALDRVTRRGPKDALDFLHRLGQSGVEFVSYQEPYLRGLGDFRDMVVDIVATIANVETKRMSERIRAGMRRAKEEGRHLGRPPKTYPVGPAEIVKERAAGASWGALGAKYGLARTSVRSLYQKGLVDSPGPGTGPEVAD